MDFDFRQVLLWLKGRSLRELTIILQEVVQLLLVRVLDVVEPDEMEQRPEPASLQEVITQTMLANGWTLHTMAQQINGMLLPRLKEILERQGDPPSTVELDQLRRVLVRFNGPNGWQVDELERLVSKQDIGESVAYESISHLVIRHWDQLTSSGIALERLQALRDGENPTDIEIVLLAHLLNLDQTFLAGLVKPQTNGAH